jgi:very-short-patch-repair endonuclease
MSSAALNSLSLLWERVGVRGSKQIKRVHGLRRASTETEKLLWQKLRARQLGGAKFRRQTPIGPYIVDFASFEHRLVVEIDSSQHNTSQGRQHDLKRTAWLEARGLPGTSLLEQPGVDQPRRRVGTYPPLTPPIKGGEPNCGLTISREPNCQCTLLCVERELTAVSCPHQIARNLFLVYRHLTERTQYYQGYGVR